MRRTALVAIVTVITLVACSGDDDAAPTTDGSADTTDGSADTTVGPTSSIPELSLVPVSPAPATTVPTVPAPSVDLPDELPTELVVTELAPGCGPAAENGDSVYVHYVGVRSEDGTQFDANFGGTPFPVQLGAGGVIPGWDQGLVGVSAGERLQLDIPADLAYGDSPQGEVIKPGDALTFVIDVLGVVSPTSPDDAPTDADLPTSDEPVDELVIDDVREGDCTTVEAGMTGIVHLHAARGDNGDVFGSTWEGQPEIVLFDESQLMAGLVQGVAGMQVGGRRIITIPADQAFGAEGREDIGVPPDTAVIVVIDLFAAF